MDGREIPGFYYDAAKRKYFKIQPNHLAPKGSQYSRENVSKTQKEKTQVEAKQTREHAESKQRVHRSSLFTSQYGLFARRELDNRGQRVLDIEPRAVGAGYLNADCIMDGMGHPVTSLAKAVSPGQYVLSTDKRVWIVGQRSFCCQHCFVGSDISSISVSGTIALVTSRGNLTHVAGVKFFRLAQLDDQRNFSRIARADIPGPPELSHFCSAANPRRDGSFLVGSTAGAALVSSEPPHAVSPPVNTGSDVLAADWLDSSTGVLGTRNGSVHLWDTRAQGSAVRLHHGSCINRIKQLDRNLLVIAGLEDNLAMYDLRMPAVQHSPRRHNKRFHRGEKKMAYTSTPVLRYPYNNHYTACLGLEATSLAGGLLFAADDQGYVNIYSRDYGDLFKRFQPPARGQSPLTHNLVFDEDEAILVGTNGGCLWRAEWMGGTEKRKYHRTFARDLEYLDLQS